MKQLTENTEVQEKMKEKLEELKESEISKKGKIKMYYVMKM